MLSLIAVALHETSICVVLKFVFGEVLPDVSTKTVSTLELESSIISTLLLLTLL